MSIAEPSLEPSAAAQSAAPHAWQRPRPAAVAAAGLSDTRCRPVGPHFVIAPQQVEDEGLLEAVAAVWHDPDALVVLAAAPDAATLLREQISELTLTASARRATLLVVAASGLGALAPNGRRPASRLAELAGMTVVAPAGPVAVQTDGTLRVDPSDGEPAAWWSCPPSGPPVPIGPVWPPPEVRTAPEPPRPPARPRTDTDVQLLARGRWIRASCAADEPMPEVFKAISAAPGTSVFVVGTPTFPAIPPDVLVEAIASAPVGGDLLISAPWADLDTLRSLAVEAAAQLQRPVWASVGLPSETASGYSARLLDRNGSPTWEPLLTELIALPDVRRLVAARWRADVSAGTTAIAPLSEAVGWETELVPAGLWVRPGGRPGDRAPRLRTPEPDRLLVFVGGAGHTIPDTVWECLPDIVERLAYQAWDDVELVLHGTMDAESAEEARALARLEGWEWRGPAPESDRWLWTNVVPGPAPRSVVDLELPTEEQADSGPAWPITVADPEGVSATVPPAVPAGTEAAPPAAAALTNAGQSDQLRRTRVFAARDVRATPASTTEEHRSAFRALLGDQYVPLLNRTQLAAARLPGLRHSPEHDVRPDLVAVLAFQLDTDTPATRADLVRAARSGAIGPLGPYLQCLASGLRLLPSHQGVVLLGAHAQQQEVDEYHPGRLLVDPAPLVGIGAADVQLGGTVEFAVWSLTGRRISAFGSSSQDPEIVFAPGTRFAVIDVVSPGVSDQPTRVLLRELGPEVTEDDAARDANVRARLSSWCAEREQRPLASLRRPANHGRFLSTPGLCAG